MLPRLLLACAACLLLLARPTARAAELVANDGTGPGYFGYGVSLSGTTGLIGAFGNETYRGSAYVYRNLVSASGPFTQSVKLVASDRAAYDNLGFVVSLSGSRALAGAWGDESSRGSAYLFRGLDTATGTVMQAAKLVASDGVAGDFFGYGLTLSGTIGLVGAVHDDSNRGSAYLYRNLDTATGTVTQSAKLVASDGLAGDYFGKAVSLSGTSALIGAFEDDSARGSAYLFRNLDTATGTVTPAVKLLASDGGVVHRFGDAVSLSGNAGLVGAPSVGAAYVFRNLDTATGTITESAKLLASDGATPDFFGQAVSLSGSNGLVGAPYDTIGSAVYQGSAYLFRQLDTVTGTVNQAVKLTASNGTANNGFGVSVSIDGDRFVVGGSDSGSAYTGEVSAFTTLDAGNASRVISRLSFTSRVDWVIGQTTSGNTVTLSAGDAGNVTLAGTGVYVGRNAGSNNNKLAINGTLTATTVTVSAASGATGNQLEVGTTGSVAATTITVNNGGTLLLSGTTASTNRLGPATSVTLASGAAFQTGGLSEGTTTAGQGTAAFGTLTLSGGSTLDFGAGANGSTLFAEAGVITGSGLISILNWTGAGESDNGAATNDRLLFRTDPPFTPAQLAQVRFYNDAGALYGIGAQEIAYSGYYELVPIPEAATAWSALGLLGWCGARRRR